jgi:hypothetical protein
MPLREGKVLVVCQHKDGSHFFVSVEIQSFDTLDGEAYFRGMIKRTQQDFASALCHLIR